MAGRLVTVTVTSRIRHTTHVAYHGAQTGWGIGRPPRSVWSVSRSAFVVLPVLSLGLVVSVWSSSVFLDV